MATEITRGFEVFVPGKTLNYEINRTLRSRYWAGACLQVTVPLRKRAGLHKVF